MSKPDFVVHFVLAPPLVRVEALLSDFFDTALAQIAWFRQKTLTRETRLEHDDAYLSALSYSENELIYAKEHAKTQTTERGIVFSFPIRHTRADFEEKNEEGKRMWLRQHLDDHFLHYSVAAMLEQSFNWEGTQDETTCERFKTHHQAFKQALQGGYHLKTPTFWIDGE